jgi:putative flippase GtrA
MINTPSTKVTAGALAGAVTALIVWAVSEWTSVDIPPEAAAALVVVISFVLSYLIRETNPAQ